MEFKTIIEVISKTILRKLGRSYANKSIFRTNSVKDKNIYMKLVNTPTTNRTINIMRMTGLMYRNFFHIKTGKNIQAMNTVP